MKDLNPCALRKLTPESREGTIAMLGAVTEKHEQFLNETDGWDIEAAALTAVGLDIVLEALGAEGHE